MNQGNRSSDLSVAEGLAEAECLPILTTKPYRPPLAPYLKQRPRLVERFKDDRRLSSVFHLPEGWMAVRAVTESRNRERQSGWCRRRTCSIR